VSGRWVWFVCLFLAASSVSGAQTAADLARKTFPSVVMIVTSDANGQPWALGSRFAVGNGVVATNEHVIDGVTSPHAKVVCKPEDHTVAGVVATNAVADLTLLKMEGMNVPFQLN